MRLVYRPKALFDLVWRKVEKCFWTIDQTHAVADRQLNSIGVGFLIVRVNAPNDRESIYYFNVMAIPPADDEKANANTIQLASVLCLISAIRVFWLQCLEKGRKVLLDDRPDACGGPYTILT
jgi:hypothetical protein